MRRRPAYLRPLRANFKGYWQAAVKVAGLKDFRFHDLRTASMMARYAHLDPATIRAAVNLLALPSASPSGTDSGILLKTGVVRQHQSAGKSASDNWCARQESNLRPSD